MEYRLHDCCEYAIRALLWDAEAVSALRDAAGEE